MDREDPLEEGKAIHSSILAWRIPWTEKPGRLQSIYITEMRSHYVMATSVLNVHWKD